MGADSRDAGDGNADPAVTKGAPSDGAALPDASRVEANVTVYVILACTIAASGGVLFGYDAGCTGGVETMQQFSQWWFPATASNKDTSFYCKFNDKPLQAYSSVMHFTGALASLPASYFTQRFGRTTSMMIAGSSYLLGSVLQAAALRSIAMIFVGRICWGIGVGFGDHCAFIYTAEMAPPRWRGRLNTTVQLGTFTGIVVANVINIGTNHLVWGWRISLGFAAVPGLILLLGGIFLPDTPNSLVERGHPEKGKEVLRRVRGTPHVDEEFRSILIANKIVKNMENPWRNILRRRNRPQLALAIAMPFLQQWSGVNAVSFFAPQIFQGVSAFSSGGNEGQLYASLLVNGLQWVSNMFTLAFVDKVGRRTLLIAGSALGLAADYGTTVAMAVTYTGGPALPMSGAIASIILVALYCISFGFSWGPIGWLIPSEIHDLNTRSAGQSITVFTQLVSGAVVTQVFLMMMCTLKPYVFTFFGAWQTIGLIFTILLIPETQGVPIEEVPIEEVQASWLKLLGFMVGSSLMASVGTANKVRSHWLWRRVAYPGGVIPEEDRIDDNDSNGNGKLGKDAEGSAANGKPGKAVPEDPTAHDATARSQAV